MTRAVDPGNGAGAPPNDVLPEGRSGGPGLGGVVLALCLAGHAWGCTTVDAAAVKKDRAAGITRTYTRPPADLYQAAVRGLESLSAAPDWRDLRITERDPAQGIVIAERDLDSVVIPGLGERDAIGIFVAEANDGDSAVTVVRMSSDQLPGSAGTSLNSARDASGLIFPAIDTALETVPEQARRRLATAPPRAPADADADAAPPVPPTSEPAPAPAPAAPAATAGSTIDRVYATLRADGRWRPLVRELGSDGAEEIRVGTWAVLSSAGGRVVLRLNSRDGSPVDAARLALELERAGFAVDVEGAASGR